MDGKLEDENGKDIPTDIFTDEKTHWVEKLFPPAFQFTLHDLVCPKTTLTTENGSQEWDNINSTFEQLSRRILPEDIEAIKNVYHRVWLIMRNHQESTQELKDQGPECENVRADTFGIEKRSQAELAVPRKEIKDLSLVTNELSTSACIWNSDEIGVLRRVYKDVKEENIKLMSQMTVMKDEMMKLKKLEKTEAKELALRTGELQEAIKANKRFEILSKYLKKELEKSVKVIKDLNERLEEMKEANTGMEKELARISDELDAERLEKRKVELEREREVDEIKTEQRQREQRMVKDSEKAQVQMVEEIKNLQEQIGRERALHKRTIRGLNHLRMHFGSLPATEEKDADLHQLNKWTCY